MIMIDCARKVSADGRDTEKFLTVCCLSESVSMDGFVVSKYLDDQAFTILSDNDFSADDSCNIPSPELDQKSVLSVETNPATERNVSVRFSQSSLYRVAKYVSSKICITINVLKKHFCNVRSCIRKIINNMKGRQKRHTVYTLCLLRL